MNDRSKSKSPNRLEKTKPKKIQNEPIKIFDSNKLSEIDDFDRMDYQKRKSDALGSKSIGPLVLESPEPAQHGGLKRAHTHSPMSEVEGTANKNSYPNSKEF